MKTLLKFTTTFNMKTTIIMLPIVLWTCLCLTAEGAVVKRINIPHNADIGHRVTSLQPLGQLFHIMDGIDEDFSKFFSIGDGGEIVTSRKVDELVGKVFSLTVNNALDGGSWLEKIHIQIFDGKRMLVFPKQQYTGHVSSLARTGAVVAGLEDIFTNSDDESLNTVRYSIDSGDDVPFLLKSRRDDARHVMLATARPLNKVKPLFTFLIVAENAYGEYASTSVKVIVDQVDRGVPRFPKSVYNAVISSQTKPGSVILKMKVIHSGPVTYRLKRPNSIFAIDSKTGTISLKTKVNPDVYAFEVTAKDASGRESNAVNIRINVEGSLKFRPKKSQKSKTTTTSENKILKRRRTRRSIGIRHRRELNRRYRRALLRRRTKRGTLVKITKNVLENVDSTTELFGVWDGKQLNSNLRFRLQDPKPRQFKINVNTGKISLLDGQKLDYDNVKNRTITFNVEVTDIQSSSPSNVEIQPVEVRVQDVNDENPVFTNKPSDMWATVDENAQDGTIIYTLMAEDPDVGSSIRYQLEAGTKNRFAVDPVYGTIRVVGNQGFHGEFKGSIFIFGVTATDVSYTPPPGGAIQSTTVRLSVKVGQKEPQFFDASYVADVPENAPNGYSIVEIKAHSFQNKVLTYSMLEIIGDGQKSDIFAIDRKTGLVTSLKSLNYETDNKIYKFLVTAIEEGGSLLSSRVTLTINLIDQNDNIPKFSLSEYVAQNIAENAFIGTSVATIAATDLDSGVNSQLEYWVDNSLFRVNNVNNAAEIVVNGKLDYDRTPGHMYKIQLYAKDKGPSPNTATTNVRIILTNVNDEKPVFIPDQSIILSKVNEDAGANTVVEIIQAVDYDGSDISYSFSGSGGQKVYQSGPFKLDPVTGVIELTRSLPSNVPKYEMDVIAEDNGRCPGCQQTQSLESRVKLIIEVIDKNNNRPIFPDCLLYNPTINEGKARGSPVIKVQAKDGDSGDNGRIEYQLMGETARQVNKDFVINVTSGQITTKKVFDYLTTDRIQVTVRAFDHGVPRLEGYCSFVVNIGDVNNHAPAFDSASYVKKIRSTVGPGSSILRVVADDLDAASNAVVNYYLMEDSMNLFKISKEDGSISATRPLPMEGTAHLVVQARDTGSQPPRDILTNALIPWQNATVTIEISKSGALPPRWLMDYSNRTDFRLKESEPPNTLAATVVAQLVNAIGNDKINYELARINNKRPSDYKDQAPFLKSLNKNGGMDILVYKALNYEEMKQYTLKVHASNSEGLQSDPMSLTIYVTDINDIVPLFVGIGETLMYEGSVAENLSPAASVIQVTAVDHDTIPAYKRVRYEMKQGSGDDQYFQINSSTGIITTKTTFDRETKAEYFFNVYAIDGAPSARPGGGGTALGLNTDHNVGEARVHVTIADRNDEKPEFAKSIYYANISEDAKEQATVLTVTAEDKDTSSQLQYFIVDGNKDNVFGVRRSIGEIFVAQPLDYDKGTKVYRLTYRVFDDLHDSTTTIQINVMNVNDNPPVFEKNVYEVKDMVVENEIPPPNGRYLLTVKATDIDEKSPQITYYLVGQYADQNVFRIDADGKIYQMKPLDREGPIGASIYDFNVRASDGLHSGYAEVRVSVNDVNDNAPAFNPNKLHGFVEEGANRGTPVLTIEATDPDNGLNGSVIYSILQSPRENGQNIFVIEPGNNLIKTNIDGIKRDATGQYSLTVQATDRGTPMQRSATASVTITVKDINDKPPKFEKRLYETTLPEQSPQGHTVISVMARDEDIVDEGQLTYRLPRGEDKKFFAIKTIRATDTGVITVYSPIDYDEENAQRVYNLTVEVFDSDNLHKDTCHVVVRLTDINDNAPVFTPSRINQTFPEDVGVNNQIASVSAVDRDQGINGEFDFSIDPKYGLGIRAKPSDPKIGLIYVARPLDREKWNPTTDKAVLNIAIKAIDRGTPPMTGTATMQLTLTDVNDNFPLFAENYQPVVYEGKPKFTHVVTVKGRDPDASMNGPPFTFRCSKTPVCSVDFNVQQLAGDGINNVADVKTMRVFDREKQKYYKLPIVMTDKHGVSGTNTLTVTIGDINDNDHNPGHKNIMIYSYEGWDIGELRNAKIGNVYAEDPDDWDRGDKIFEAKNPNNRYFNVMKNGDIFLKTKVPAGSHQFEVVVTDTVRSNRQVVSTVTAIVQDISAEPVYNAGSFRLIGITAEQFVEKPKLPNAQKPSDYGQSKYDLVRGIVAKSLNTQYEYVDIFTVMNVPGQEKPTIDVRYTAHGSPHYKPSKLNSAFEDDKAQYANILGPSVQIDMSPVDLCKQETCESGCTNRLVVTNAPLLINTNSTSLVGINSYVVKECVCATQSAINQGPPKCTPATCYNGGTCREEGEVVRCDCLPGFNGGRCQLTKKSFGGNGWAWYPPLKQCKDGHISLEFVTLEATGLLLYSGPRKTPKNEDLTDFIAIDMTNGYPRVTINHGSGRASGTIDGKDKDNILKINPINDGKWHRLDIYRKGNEVRMMLDYCSLAALLPRSSGQPMDTKPCEVTFKTPGQNQFINVDQPLQLGGRQNVNFPQNIANIGFNGCIKNLMVNGELYDLHIGQAGLQSGSVKDGCPQEDRSCGVNEPNGPYCGPNGVCTGNLAGQMPDGAFHCSCKPGWAGARCTIKTKIRDFKKNSYIQWKIKNQIYLNKILPNPYQSKIELMFRTRQTTGVLFHTMSTAGDKAMTLRITNSELNFIYALGSEQRTVKLPNVNVADGAWHTAKIERWGKMVFLKLDGGEGRYYNYDLGGTSNYYQILIEEIFAGAIVKFASRTQARILPNDDYQESCMNDVSYNDLWLSLSAGMVSPDAEILKQQNIIDGCQGNVCQSNTCDVANNFKCIELWRKSECRCKVGYKLTNSTQGQPICININECIPYLNPCLHGLCLDTPGGYKCNCEPEWSGEHCDQRQEAVVASMASGAVIAIIICILILLLIVLVFIVYTRRRRQPKDQILEIYPDDDIRENIVHYDEEGAGEEDQDAYDISRLSKPVDPAPNIPLVKSQPLQSAPPAIDRPDNVGDFISDRLKNADDDPSAPPHDTLHEFDDEGGGSTAGSLSSLNSSSDGDQDYDYLNDWGPKFSKLADMYGGDE
ncbi:neural-cadherin-like [Tubulanus polymorphus]|uniref:neural-cadherin-like n=1 Tax=Tubulanus polymorphus TaxID=672921 RepID=UPI003DA43A05